MTNQLELQYFATDICYSVVEKQNIQIPCALSNQYMDGDFFSKLGTKKMFQEVKYKQGVSVVRFVHFMINRSSSSNVTQVWRNKGCVCVCVCMCVWVWGCVCVCVGGCVCVCV